MNIGAKIKEKTSKLYQYIRLRQLFSKDCEFSRVHPELMKLWEKKFRQMIRYSSDRTFPIAEEFVTVKFEKCTKREVEAVNENIPILICAVKNDVEKMHYFMEHYRDLGIEEFVFVDNMSTDGTFEFLMEQPDTIVYRCEHPFTADRKIAWINRLIAEMGIDKWYLMVDSDEFFTFLGVDNGKNFKDVVEYAEKIGVKRLGVMHLDLYPKGTLFEKKDQLSFAEKYCYFDKDTYAYGKTKRGMAIFGGPRSRVFGTKVKISGYRMIFFEKDDIVPSAHYMIPYEKSYNVPLCLISKHYKFVNESDYEKIIEAVETGMHSDNSAEYKTYLKGIMQNQEVSFYSEEHSLLFTEDNLKKIDIIDNLFED